MFDIGWSELLVVGMVAMIVVGPKELPALMRTIGNFIGKIKETASSFQRQFHQAVEESELGQLKTDVDELSAEFSPDKLMGGIESFGPDFDEFDPDDWNKDILEKERSNNMSSNNDSSGEETSVQSSQKEAKSADPSDQNQPNKERESQKETS